MNQILDTFATEFPTVEVTEKHRREADRADNPQAVAEALPLQIASMRKLFDEVIGSGIATDADIAECINLNSTATSHGNFSVGTLLYPLGIDRAFELGQRAAQKQAANMHWIVALYLEHDERFPDAAGFAFWLGLIAEGHSEDTVREWILDGLGK